MTYENTPAFARQLDADDPLHDFRDRFYIPQRNGKPLVYLCGNSLGLLPKDGRISLAQELDRWEEQGVEGWFSESTESGLEGSGQPWLNYHDTCKAALSQIVGASASEVCPMNALTVNLHLLLASFYRPTERNTRF